jgi:hypothetical protein
MKVSGMFSKFDYAFASYATWAHSLELLLSLLKQS